MPFAVFIGYGPVRLRFFSGSVTRLPNTTWSMLGLVEDKDVALATKLADVDGCKADLDSDWDDIL